MDRDMAVAIGRWTGWLGKRMMRRSVIGGNERLSLPNPGGAGAASEREYLTTY